MSELPEGIRRVYSDADGLLMDQKNLPVGWTSNGIDRFVAIVETDPVTGRISLSTGSDIVPEQHALGRWYRKLNTDAANAKIVLIGDSTSDYATSSAGLTDSLRNFHTLAGQSLYGMTADSSHILAKGYDGFTLLAWLADPAKLTELSATGADLVIASFGLNDVRLGLCTLAQMQDRLSQLVAAIKSALPGADVLLRMPNTMLTTNVSSFNYVQDSVGTINPTGLAQTYSSLLRSAYLSMIGRWGHVDVIDIQSLVFGTAARASHPLMADQLHPAAIGSTVGTTPSGGGYVEIAKVIAKKIGSESASYVLDDSQYRIGKSNLFCVAGGNGYIDVATQNVYGVPACQYPLSNSDSLFIDGIPSPVALTSATIYRPFGGNNIRISVTGDYTSAVGKRIYFAGAHPDASTEDRQIVSVDLPSIAAGALATTTAAVTGARTGDLHDATSITCTPPAAFVSAGLVLLNCYPSANDIVKLLVHNPTGSPVDLAANNFAFWVIR